MTVEAVNYKSLSPPERRRIRGEYIAAQRGLCAHCKKPLSDDATEEIRAKKIRWNLFPKDFLKWPIHLHHSHDTGMTIGAVHAYCNAVLWQYHGE